MSAYLLCIFISVQSLAYTVQISHINSLYLRYTSDPTKSSHNVLPSSLVLEKPSSLPRAVAMLMVPTVTIKEAMKSNLKPNALGEEKTVPGSSSDTASLNPKQTLDSSQTGSRDLVSENLDEDSRVDMLKGERFPLCSPSRGRH